MNKSIMDVVSNQVQSAVPVALLSARGTLDRFTYLDLINKAKELYDSGQRFMVLDMSGIREMGISGLFALYSIAMIFRDEEPLESEGGWAAVRSMASHLDGSFPSSVKLLKPQPQIEKALSSSRLPFYEDLTTALASF